MIHPSACVEADIPCSSNVWHFSHVCEGALIGRNVTIGQGCYVAPTGIVGDGCKLQNGVYIWDGVMLGDNVFVGPNATFTNVVNPRAHVNRHSEFEATVVEEGVTIGANATIVCGVRLGHHCFVAAGAVVTRDVKPYSLVMGSPARHVRYIDTDGNDINHDTTTK